MTPVKYRCPYDYKPRIFSNNNLCKTKTLITPTQFAGVEKHNKDSITSFLYKYKLHYDDAFFY